MPLLCKSSTRSGNQPVIDAIRTTGLGTDQIPHPDGVTHLQPPLGPSFGSRVSTRRRGHIAAAHSDASTAPRIDSLDTMSGPAAIASPNLAAVACEIDKIQTKINHPAGFKPAASKNSPEEQTRRTDPPHLPTPICPASPTSDAAPANPKISLGQPHRYHAGIPGSSRLHTPPITHTPVPRETGQRTRVTHKSPPALNADQAMNLFRDKTIKLLNRTMRIARVCFAFEDGADALPKHEAHIQHIRTFLFVDPRSGAPAAGHAAATGSRKHGSVPRETERVRPSMLRTPPEGRTPSSIRLLTTPHALNRDGWFHVKRVAVIPFHWIGCARPTTFRALLTAR